MGKYFGSALLAGAVAGVLWISFCLAFGWEDLRAVGIFGIVVVVGTTLVANIIAVIVDKASQGSGQRAD